MSLPASALDMKAISVNRRLKQWFAYYVIGLWGVLAVSTGLVVMAVFVIGASEMLRLLWRRTPPPPDSYADPVPAGWQMPIAALRWYVLLRNIAGLAGGAVVATVFMGFFIVVSRSNRLGPWNFVVVILFGLWLLTRPLWFPVLVRTFQHPLQDVQKELQSVANARLSLAGDGIDIAIPIKYVGTPRVRQSWVFHVAFSEVDELREFGTMEAEAYWDSLGQYDRTIAIRAGADLFRYANGQIPRPTIYNGVGLGPNLLVRGSNLLYVVGLADDSGPAAVAAWQAWRAAHQIGPTT